MLGIFFFLCFSKKLLILMIYAAAKARNVSHRHGICITKSMSSGSTCRIMCDFWSRWGFMVIFWNFAGVPFVRPSPFLSSPIFIYFVDLRLLRCVHGVSRPIEIPFLNSHLCRVIRNSTDCILYVCLSNSSLCAFPTEESDGTLQCPRNPASKCRRRV